MNGWLIGVGAVAGAIGGALVSSTSQCRRPHGRTGRRVLQAMNVRHSSVTDWGLGHIRVEPGFRILDVGCGGGRTIQKLAAVATQGHVSGVDYSEASVAEARAVNQAEITAGRVDVQQASVSRLPFSDAAFDLVTAVETHYYWPDFVSDLKEARRVLKPGGTLALIAETYRGQAFGAVIWPSMLLLRARYLTVAQHREALAAAGFTGVTVTTDKWKGWISAVGKRPG